MAWLHGSKIANMAEPAPGTSERNIPVINFRALLAMKLFALKDGETRKHKDLMDIRFLLEYGHTRLPEEEFKVLCERYAGPGAYEKIKFDT